MRNRHQEGWIEERGKRRKSWYGHYFVYEQGRRKHRGVWLGWKSELRKWEAQEKLRAIIAQATQAGMAPTAKPDTTFHTFYEQVFLKLRQGRWAEATRRGNEKDVKLYLYPVLRDRKLNEFDRLHCQTFINALAEEGYSRPVVQRAKTMLWSIFDIAVDQEYIAKNPMERVDLPVCKAIAKPVLVKADAYRLINAIGDVRDRLILLLGIFGGPRASEVFGLQWGCVQGSFLEIRNTAYNGKLYVWRVKRKASFRRIYLPPLLQEAFEQWRKVCLDCSPDALVFPSRKTGRPMWPGAFLQDHVQPIARSLGITVPITFQVLRRSCATRNQRNGSLKDVQTQLGHGSIETTGDVYMMEIPESVMEMVERDVRDVMSQKSQVN